ncbi:MAG: glutathione S-transferase [Verrucomicrobiota bacterium]|nr:glutathione S-transferase [Verrucomicrobiota bacterium]
MAVILYQMAHSPFCIPIAQALTAWGVEFTRREVPNWDRSELLRLTKGAYYQVPVLVHDGRILIESGSDTQDVARYVDRTFAGGRLFPERLDGLQRIVIDFLENDVEARTFKLVDIHYIPAIEDVAVRGMVVRHKERRFGRGCVDEWHRDSAEIRVEADALLERFEVTLRYSPFLFGEEPVYSDFALFGIAGNLTFKNWNRLHEQQTALREWSARMSGFRML